MDSTKAQTGIWNSTQAYPSKIKFETDKAVTVTFPSNFVEPKEMPPMKVGDKPFLIFDVLEDGKQSVIMTSSLTLIKSLKGQEPLANKTLIITKKNVAGKNFFYVTTPDANTI